MPFSTLNRLAPIVALLISFVFHQSVTAQQGNDLSKRSEQADELGLGDNPIGTGELIANMDDVRSLISNLQLYMNFLGDESTGLRDKDVIINESYSKIFLGEGVQIEDDLDTNRQVVTYKPVQAYLKDIDFFFNNVSFEISIESIEQSYRENGEPFYLVTTNRLLEARDLRDSSLSNQQKRFIEINLLESGELKIASIYTTQLNTREERRLWWNNLPEQWRKQIAGTASLTTEVPFAAVSYFDEQILLTATDTFLLAILETDTGQTTGLTEQTAIRSTLQVPGQNTQSSQVEMMESFAMAAQNWPALEIRFAEIDRQLEQLVQQRSLVLDKSVTDLAPISRMTELRKLDLSNRALTDLSPVRQLSKLRELNISGNPIDDLSPLRYLAGLEVLIADSTQIESITEIRRLKNLRQLSLANAPLNSINALSALGQLQQLNISGAQVDSLLPLSGLKGVHELILNGSKVVSLDGLENLPQLRLVDASNTAISKLAPLSKSLKLERLLINNTSVADLSPLKGLEQLKIIYCDGSKVDKAAAESIMSVSDGLLVVYASDYLKTWWSGMPSDWGKIFQDIYGFKGVPNDEMLQRMTGLRALDLTTYPHLNKLTPIQQLHKLEELTIDGTNIQSIEELTSISSLKKFSAAGCQLESIQALNGHLDLRQVDLGSTGLNDLSPLYNLEELEWVLADSNEIGDSVAIAFRSYRPEALLIYRTPKLEKWWNGLDETWQNLLLQNLAREENSGSPTNASPDKFTLEKLARSKRLFVRPSTISGLDHIRMLSDLEELYFQDNRVYSLSPLRELKRLRIIDCSKNPIVEIGPLSVMQDLEVLNLSNTPIKSLEDINGLKNLKQLNCSGTPIKQLNALSALWQLEELDCSNTKVRSLKALAQTGNLTKLIAFNTALSKYKIEAFQATHPDCEVVFY